MKRKLPKSFFEKERPRIKNESKQGISPVIYSADVEKGKVKYNNNNKNPHVFSENLLWETEGRLKRHPHPSLKS